MERLIDELIEIGKLRNYYFKETLRYRKKRNLSKIASIGTSMISTLTTSPFTLLSNIYTSQLSNDKSNYYEEKYRDNRMKYLGYEDLYIDLQQLLYSRDSSPQSFRGIKADYLYGENTEALDTPNYINKIIGEIKERIRLIELCDISVSFDEAIIV